MTKRLSKSQTELLDDLVGQIEIAELLGVSRSLVSMWLRRPATGFPAPVARLQMGPIFRRSEVQAWSAARNGGDQ